MKNSRLFFQLTLTYFILSCMSCTIEKRVHNFGYHIDWNKSNSGQQFPEKKSAIHQQTEKPDAGAIRSVANNNLVLENKESSEAIENSLVSIAPNDIDNTSEVPLLDKIFPTDVVDDNVANEANSGKEDIKISIKTTTSSEGEISYLSLIGFALSLIAWGLLFAFGFPYLFGLFGIFVSAMGLNETIKKHKWGKGFAIFGLLLGVGVIIGFILFYLDLGGLATLFIAI